MDFSHYTDYPTQLAMELVNTRSPVRGDDRLATVPDLAAFVTRVAENWVHPDWRLTEGDLDAVTKLRSQLRTVFGATDDVTAAAVLNEILEASGAAPRVSLHSATPHLHFEPDGGSLADWLGALTATGLAFVVSEHGIDRLGTCASERCGHVFIDTSRNCSRRYCSDTCANRENVAAYRRRSQAAAAELTDSIAD